LFDAQEWLAHLGSNYLVINVYLHCHQSTFASLAPEAIGEDLQSVLMVRDGEGTGQQVHGGMESGSKYMVASEPQWPRSP
jgi:hypothetical protein